MRTTRLLVITFACLLSWSASEAAAKELPAEVRAMAERAFLEGRYEDLDTILVAAKEPADRLPLVLYRTWWRLPDGDALSLPTQPPYPKTGSGGARWSLIDALRSDRMLRETTGGATLPGASPLMAYRESLDAEKDSETIWFLEDVFRLMEETYGGPESISSKDRRRFERQRNTTQIIALGALGAFIVLCFFGALGVARYRPEPGTSEPDTDERGLDTPGPD